MGCKIRDTYNKSVDSFVDNAMKLSFGSLEKISYPLKATFEAMGVDNMKKSTWFTITDIQKSANAVVNDYRNMKAFIYDEANTLMKGLDTLSQEDNKSLIKSLNGDISRADLKPTLFPFYDKFRAIIDKNATELVNAGVLDSKDKIENYLKRYYKDYIDNGVNKSSSLAYDKLKKRKDLTYDERIALGMIEDATFVISKTIAEQNVLLQKAKVLQSLADNFASDVEIEGYIRISDATAKKGLKKYGPLSGKWVHPDVKREMDYARIVDEEMGKFEKFLYPIIDHLKVNLTVKNPVTHIYNIASNLLLAGLNGDLLSVGKVLNMRATNPTKFKELVRTANKYGLNSYLDDFEKAELELNPDKTTNIAVTLYKNLYMTKDSKVGGAVRNLYDWEDKIFKIASFYKLMEEGLDEKSAFKEAINTYVDYSTPLPAGLKVLDKSGLMPFLHYQYKSTPAVAKVMAKHPIRTLLLATGAASLGLTSFQNDDKELKLPEWANDKFNLLGIAEWLDLGNGYYLNAGRMIPGTKFEFEFGGIVKSAIDIMFQGKTPLGYNIADKYDDKLEQYGKRALAMSENFLPSLTLGRYAQRSIEIGLGKAGIVEPKQNYYGEDMGYPELIQRAVGVRRFNEEKELKTKLKEAGNKKKYEDKQKNTDKKENQKEYDATARRIKSVAKTDITSAPKEDGFSFPKFDLK